MKKILILPVSLGLLLGACSRTETPKTTASNQPDPNQPAATTPKDSASPADSSLASAPNPSVPKMDDKTTNATKAPSSSLAPTPTPPAADLALNPRATTTPVASEAAVGARISEWRLKGDDIKNEFDASGRVVRSKAPSTGEPTGPMDSVLVSSVKGKLRSDSELAAQKIDAEADDGIVTLKGTAASLDKVGRAIAISLDTAGVKQVVSTIKLESKQ